MLREYCYDKDYNFYHFKNNHIRKITRKEYKLKTGESDFIIEKLRNCRWPHQVNDYFFLKFAKNYWPIDWKLYNLIKFFKSNNISTSSSEQGGDRTINKGLIIFNNIEDIEKIKLLFGQDNLKIFPKITITSDPNNINIFDKKKDDKELREANKYHHKIRIYPEELIEDAKINKRFRASFNQVMIKWMHKKLKLDFPKHSKAHKGSRIISIREVKKFS